MRPALRKHWVSCLLGVILSLTACTSIIVRPLEFTPQARSICIQENAKVIVSDFLPVLREGLSRHKIASHVFQGRPPKACELVLTYTALRSWDLAPYLSHAELRLERNGMEVGYGEFHLRGKGGYSMFKWQGTKTKMDPVIDQLFADF